MFPLVLSGYSSDLNVREGKLLAREWVFENLEGKEVKHILKPRQHTFDSIFIYGDKGRITVSALEWLNRYNIPVTVLDRKGNITSQQLGNQNNGNLKIKQFESYYKNRLEIGKEIIRAKISRQQEVIGYLSQRYDIKGKLEGIKDISRAKSNKELLGIEGITANRYFSFLKEVLKFPDRDNGFTHRPMNSIDPINSLLNYGYSILESIIRHSLVSTGLDTTIGYVHEVQPGKEPLVYDFQEPYRFLIDLTVIRMIEQHTLKKAHFTHNKDWVIKLTRQGIEKLLSEIQLTFNTPVKYNGKFYKWDSVIDLQIREFANYLVGKAKMPDFAKPEIQLKRTDNQQIRGKIKNMSYAEWKKRGYSKGSLHYLKHNLDKPNFKVYGEVREKLE